MTKVLIRRGKSEHRHTEGRQRQSPELYRYKPRSTQPPNARRGKEGVFPRVLGESMALLTSGFSALPSSTVENKFLSHSVVVIVTVALGN